MRKTFLIIIVCLLTLSLSACQLADPDAGKDAGKDRLIGVLVTTEPLDMMYREETEPVAIELTEAEMNRLLNGDSSVLSFPERKYYAELVTETATNGKTGETAERQVYSFAHLGYALMAPTMNDGEGEYVAAGSDDALCDVKTHIKHTDDTLEELILSGTLYQVIGTNEDCVLEMNPIYQTADGQVYAVNGHGMGFSSGVDSEGAVFSQTTEESVTVREGNHEVTHSTEVTVSLSLMYEPKEVILLQMDADGNVLARETYAAGSMPESITPEADTAFFIVETIKLDTDGNEIISAELVDQTEYSFQTFYAIEKGFCIPQTTELNWS